jgi:hypothetical protein
MTETVGLVIAITIGFPLVGIAIYAALWIALTALGLALALAAALLRALGALGSLAWFLLTRPVLVAGRAVWRAARAILAADRRVTQRAPQRRRRRRRPHAMVRP